MARELVVPWSRAKTYFGISMISPEWSSLLELKAERQMELAAGKTSAPFPRPV
jgi:hypothetical protein